MTEQLRQPNTTSVRKQRAEQAARLRASGLSVDDIAEFMQVSRSYASALLSDPDREKERKRRDGYRRPCPECGTLMDGSGGANGPRLCAACASAAQSAGRVWTRESILAAFREFHRVTGRTPTVSDVTGLAPTQAAHLSDARVSEVFRTRRVVRLPVPQVVQREFGSWRAGVVAAGMTPAASGGLGHRRRVERVPPGQARLLALLASGPKTAAEVGEALSVKWPGRMLRRLVQKGLVESRREGRSFVYEVREGAGMAGSAWRVLQQSGDTYRVVGEVAAPSRELAVERVVQEPGEYVAVRVSEFVPLTVRPVERLSVVTDG